MCVQFLQISTHLRRMLKSILQNLREDYFKFVLTSRLNEHEVRLSSNLCRHVGAYLFSRAVASQVSSARQSLTSVFGMGTGGPSALITPTNLRCHFHVTDISTPNFTVSECTFRDSNPGPTD